MTDSINRSAKRVLVVDDEERVRAFVTRALRDEGYEVMVASDGPEALRLVEGEPRAFDLFVVDVAMPQMRGDELGRQLRQQDPDVKVLYFTGFSDLLFKSRHSLQEHEAFIEKPVTVSALLEAVSLLLFGHTNGPSGSPSAV
jgi:two-component system cell cycle sensor histidine kinase/response regulator CckA